MVASMLQACGLKVGVYTSPHLTDIRERICVDGDMISRHDFARIINHVKPAASRINPPSKFTSRPPGRVRVRLPAQSGLCGCGVQGPIRASAERRFSSSSPRWSA